MSSKKIEEQIKKLYKDAQMYSDKNDNIKAISLYTEMFELHNTNKISIKGKYHGELAKLYQKENLFKDAAQELIEYLKSIPSGTSTYGVLLNEVGVCYFNIKMYKDALKYFKLVLKMAEIPDVYNNMACCYRHLNQYDLCEESLLKSLKIAPENKSTHYSLTEIYYLTKEYKKGIYYFTLSKTTESDFIYNASFCFLALKNFKMGYKLYEHRLSKNKINEQTKLKERVDIDGVVYWDGETLCNNVLIIYEQGIGDNIQYFRFIIEAVLKFPSIQFTFLCNNVVGSMFNISNYPNLKIIRDIKPVDFHCYDYKVYTMSLPFKLGVTSIFPNKINYIKINPKNNNYWKEKLSTLKKFKVAIVYNGLLESYLEKYIPLEEFSQLIDLPIDIICLQRKSEIENDINKLSFKDKIHYYDIDTEAPFIDTIAILQNIDLLITIDTYIVHLAGILGVKTWLLLGKVSEWRWSTESTTYWYNNIEIMRGKENLKLKNIMPEVKERLKKHLEIYELD
jgi:ADP-heptose:LPS heptosyltransferase